MSQDVETLFGASHKSSVALPMKCKFLTGSENKINLRTRSSFRSPPPLCCRADVQSMGTGDVRELKKTVKKTSATRFDNELM